MEAKHFIIEYWQQISLTIGGVAAFITGRKTKKNNEKNGELENIEKVREIEKKLLKDMEEQILKLIENNDRLELIVRKQSDKLRAYEMKFGSL